MIAEEWRPVVGFEGYYEISNTGVVRGVERSITVTRMLKGKEQSFTWTVPSRVIKQGTRPDGYKDVPLSKGGKSEVYCIHRLLAEAFIPNPQNLPVVNHIDANKSNNSLSNLEWVSYTDNVLHEVIHHRHKQAIPVECVETGESFPSIHQAEQRLHLPKGSVYIAIHNATPVHGYTFKKLINE